MKLIEEVIKERILVLDGAMGTMIQQYDLQEEDFNTIEESFARNPKAIKSFLFVVIFIIAPPLLSYALMNFGQ